MTQQSKPVIALGTVLRMRASHYWGIQVGQLSQELAVGLSGVSSPVGVEVHFHVGTEVDRLDFHEIRTGRFSRKLQKLWVQVPLQDGVVDGPRLVLLDLIAQAVDIAEGHLAEKGLVPDLGEIRRAIDEFRANEPQQR